MHSGPAGHSSKGSHGSQVRVVHVHDVLFMGVCVLDIVHSITVTALLGKARQCGRGSHYEFRACFSVSIMRVVRMRVFHE